MTGAERQFPVIVPRDRKGREIEVCPTSVPWSLLESHRARASRNHGQTLEELAARGGLAPNEIHAIVHDQKWRPMDAAESVAWLVERLAAAQEGVVG